METSSTARKLSARFVAGNTLEEALTASSKLHDEGLRVTLDYLGENVTSIAEASACRDACMRTLEAMRQAGMEPNISVKLTQLGLDLSPGACEANAGMLAEAAAAMNGFLRIDMESTEYTDRTLGIVTRLHERYGSCGTVIQSYLFRSRKDIECLRESGIRVRLCKGAYLESPKLAFPQKTDVDRNYLLLAGDLLRDGNYPAIATHDENMIAGVKALAETAGRSKDTFEFQMLYGIRRDLQKQLVAEGYRMRVYVPYGEAWYPYFMRRLAERPANVIFIARNLLRN